MPDHFSPLASYGQIHHCVPYSTWQRGLITMNCHHFVSLSGSDDLKSLVMKSEVWQCPCNVPCINTPHSGAALRYLGPRHWFHWDFQRWRKLEMCGIYVLLFVCAPGCVCVCVCVCVCEVLHWNGVIQVLDIVKWRACTQWALLSSGFKVAWLPP